MKRVNNRRNRGNTALFRVQNGRYIKRKDVLGAGIFTSILKGIKRHAPKIVSAGKKAGKVALTVAKNELKKPKNQKLLKNVSNHVIDSLTGHIGMDKNGAQKNMTRKIKKKKHIKKNSGRKVGSKMMADFGQYLERK